MFDVGFGEVLLLGVLALVIFGDKLPTVAQQAGRTLRQLRQMANSAKRDLQEGLGPEFANFDPADLHPRRFVQKHLLSDIDDLDDPLDRDAPPRNKFLDVPTSPTWDDNARPPLRPRSHLTYPAASRHASSASPSRPSSARRWPRLLRDRSRSAR